MNPNLELLPGPQLDAAVAELVMGKSQKRKSWFADGRGNITTRLPKFSSDIAAAWTAVNKLKGLGFYLVLADGKDDQGCIAVFESATSPGEKVTASTAPHAICLAALRAVQGREVKP